MMVICAEMRAFDDNELAFKRRALRDAVICIGWLKLVSIICYICLYFLVHSNSKGHMSTILQIMIIVVIPFQILHGTLLFLGALEDKLIALELSLWMCLLLASYNTVLGIMGAIYFIRTGFLTMHFFLSLAFTLLAISLFTVICHDILIVYAYKQIVQSPHLLEQPNRPVQQDAAVTYPQQPDTQYVQSNPHYAQPYSQYGQYPQ